MRIKSSKGNRSRTSGSAWFILLMVLAIGTLLTIGALRNIGSRPEVLESAIVCDAENVEDGMFINGEYRFKGGVTRSSERAYEGSYSSKLGGEYQYGIGYDIVDPHPGTKYKVTVWVSRTSGDRGRLAVAADDINLLYDETSVPLFRREDGWELLQLFFVVPDKKIDLIKVYTYVPENSGAVFFDNFTITTVQGSVARVDSIEGALSTMKLTISPESYSKLTQNKWNAYASGILITEDDSWVKGDIQTASNADIPVELRLKGDWLDHVYGDKWSLRIKTDDNYSWNRLITFSIQSPDTRSFLREWFYHQCLQAADVLTPRYDFISVVLNEKELGAYAYEEHFDKQIVESRRRREGPIIKLSEDGFWSSYKLQEDIYGAGDIGGRLSDSYWRSEIQPFKEKKLFSNQALADQFQRAQELLYSYKYGQLEAGEVFDLGKFGAFLAIVDLNIAYHGLAWHNLRFYYNPISGQLEPIGFDGFGPEKPVVPTGHPFIGYFQYPPDFGELIPSLFRDPNFVRAYHNALWRYSDPSWFNNLLADLGKDIRARENFLSAEYPDSKLDVEGLQARAREIRYYLTSPGASSIVTREIDITGDSLKVGLSNAFHVALEVVGYTGSDKEVLKYFNNAIYLPSQRKFDIPGQSEVTVPAYARNIVYRVAGLGEEYLSVISKLPMPKIISAEEAVLPASDLQNFSFIDVIGDEAVVRSGRHLISEDLVFPKGMSVIMEPGADLDITNSAKVMIQGRLTALATAETPITIRSSDKSASGFTVLNADGVCKLAGVHFDNLNTLRDPGRTLTGAVTFYECNVEMRGCHITQSQCEDALNVVRCQVDINGMFISNTMFDALDSDFSTGKIEDIRFENVSNDALDFSGSRFNISNLIVRGAGDKGISCGEESHIYVESADLQGCNIGVASKDLSLVEIREINLVDCKQGFTAYRKKPEFGGATLIVHEFTAEDVKQLYLIEKNSVLQLGERKIEGL